MAKPKSLDARVEKLEQQVANLEMEVRSIRAIVKTLKADKDAPLLPGSTRVPHRTRPPGKY